MSDHFPDAADRFARRLERSAEALARRDVVRRARERVLPKLVPANDQEPAAA